MVEPVSRSNNTAHLSSSSSFSTHFQVQTRQPPRLNLIDVIMRQDIAEFYQMLRDGFEISLSMMERKKGIIKISEASGSICIRTKIKAGSRSSVSSMRVIKTSMIHSILQASQDIHSLISCVEQFVCQNPFRQSLLTWGATQGNAAFVAVLLQHELPVNHTDIEGNTPLIHAAKWGHTEIGTLLLQAGADAHVTNELRETALFHAHVSKNILLCAQLVSAGAKRSIGFIQEEYCEIPERQRDTADEDAFIKWEAVTQKHMDDHDGGFNSFHYDLEDALDKAYKIIQEERIDLSDVKRVNAVKQDCLLEIIHEKYKSIYEPFDHEKMEDAINQVEQYHEKMEQATTPREKRKVYDEYEYAVYDQKVLQKVIDEYQDIKKLVRMTENLVCAVVESDPRSENSVQLMQKLATKKAEFQSSRYEVKKYRLPGDGVTDEDYNTLRAAAIELFSTEQPVHAAKRRRT